MSRNETKADWELFVAGYVVETTVDRPDLGGFLTEGGGVLSSQVPDFACQLMVDGYDSEALCLAAGEEPDAPGLKELFDKALHEIGFLPLPRLDAALLLLREYASQIVSQQLSEHHGISQIWGVLTAVPELRSTKPFDVISATEEKMYYHWPYHEAENKALVQDYAKAIIDQYGARV